ISGRDEGVSDANDGSRRRNVSGAAFSLTGRCRTSDRGLRNSAAAGSSYKDARSECFRRLCSPGQNRTAI
ncbi:MAG: hypothetical protein MJY46_05280, partial [Bacteroidales bacterium]|nr:hypothetical protein [Bacteroidales bacterium]